MATQKPVQETNPEQRTLRARSRQQKNGRLYCAVAALMFIAGLIPLITNLTLDPFEMHNIVDLGIAKKDVSEKAHYPLWKTIHYPEETAEIVVIGDSRARALQDRYWHDLGLDTAYNFAYGGVTLYEIRDTFNYVRDHHENLKTLVVGIQLRSFDIDHKHRMNRVPEAIRLVENPFDYYASWFVLQTGMQTLDHTYGSTLQRYIANLPRPSSTAHADTGAKQGNNKLRDLLEPVICENCLLPENVAPQLHSPLTPVGSYFYGDHLGLWSELWRPGAIDRHLPVKFDTQIRKNAASDWRHFEFSELFWSWMVEMSTWCEDNDIRLIFFIPPTILEMQNVQADFGHGKLNHEFRLRLAALGTVVDFDYDTPLTRDLARFRDAYHFNASTSKLIIGELALLAGAQSGISQRSLERARKRREDVICPIFEEDLKRRKHDNAAEALEGQSCRIWRALDE